jgi:hypothetical protein
MARALDIPACMRKLFPSLVAACALLAIAAACGGRQLDATGAGGTASPSSAGQNGCPSTAPDLHGACGLSSEQSCRYGGDGDCGAVFSCVSGAWQETVYDCDWCRLFGPEPAVGSSCSAPPEISCTFHRGECDAQHNYPASATYSCVAGGWRLVETTSCNAPAPQPEAAPACPSTEPAPGDPCTDIAQDCPYRENECDAAHGYQSAKTYACTDGAWKEQYTPPCNRPVCPDFAPPDGLPCGADIKCSYDTCSGSAPTEADCVSGTWHVNPAACPPLDAGSGPDA